MLVSLTGCSLLRCVAISFIPCWRIAQAKSVRRPLPKSQYSLACLIGIVNLRLAISSKSTGWEVLFAPCGVRLPGQPVPVQPDIFFVHTDRRQIVGEEYVEGAPDLVVEILSPSNWLYDRTEKFRSYQTAGVGEYWIVDPRAYTIEIFTLEAGTYVLQGKFGSGERVPSQVLSGFEVLVDEVFAE